MLELIKEEIQDEGKFVVENETVEMSTGETMSLGDLDNVELQFISVTYTLIDVINPFLHTLPPNLY